MVIGLLKIFGLSNLLTLKEKIRYFYELEKPFFEDKEKDPTLSQYSGLNWAKFTPFP